MSIKSNTALLVVDVQNDVVGAAYKRDAVVSNIALLVERARQHAVPVIWVQHDDEELPVDSEGWQIVDEPEAAEPIIRKHYRDAFEATDLAGQLTHLDVSRRLPTGDHMVAHTNLVWDSQTHPTATASVEDAASVVF